MLKNRKIVTKIRNVIIGLIAVIIILGFFISVRQIKTNIIAIDELKNVKSGLRIAAIDIDERKSNKSNL